MMMANVFACLHWDPPTFWNLTTDQYIAGMYGIWLQNRVVEETTEGTNLSDDDIEHLRDMLDKDMEKNANN